MSYINGGVRRINTKAALKAAVKADASQVTFYSTSLVGGQLFDGPVSEMPEGATLSVVGPDPYNSRKWYASIKRGPKGITVS